MKRRDLLRHLEKCGCQLAREGAKHTIYVNGDQVSAVPRHREVDTYTARKICRELGIDKPKS